MKPKGLSGPLIRKNLSRYWLLSLGILVILLIQTLSLLQYLGNNSHLTPGNTPAELWKEEIYWDAYFWELFFSLPAAFLVFSYLYKKRENHFCNSLPMSKDSLYYSSLLSGLLLYVLPWLLVLLITTPIAISHAEGDIHLWGLYVLSRVYHLMLYVISYAMAVLAVMLCGRWFFGILCLALLHFILLLPEIMVLGIADEFLYGFYGGENLFSTIFSPFLQLILLLDQSEQEALPWIPVGIYTAIALLLLFLPGLLHRKRKEERVGQTLVFPRLYSVLQILMTVLGAVLLAALFEELFGLTMKTYPILLCSIPVFFLCRMLLLRSLKVFDKKTFLRFGSFFLCFLAVILVFQLDLFGIEKRMPDADTVETLRFSLGDMEFVTEDREDIEDFIAIHQFIIDRKDSLPHSEPYYGTSRTLNIIYEKPGMDLKRTYYEDNDFVLESIAQYFTEGDRAMEQVRQAEESVDSVFLRFYFYPDPYSTLTDLKDITLSTVETQEFFAALALDIAEGFPPPMIQQYSETGSATAILLGDNHEFFIHLPLEGPHALQFYRDIEAQYIKEPEE